MVPKLTDISRISVVVHVSDHFVDRGVCKYYIGPSRFSAANRIFAADIPRNRFIGEKPPCAAVRVLNENNHRSSHLYSYC